jgi:hypothetical protein
MKRVKTTLLIFGFLAIMADMLYAQDVTIIYTGQTHAMLYPCNCPIRQDGGISRRATLIKELRKNYPGLLLLDCGSFTAGGALDEYTQNTNLDQQRSEVNYKALELMQYDAVGVGPDEFNFGREFFLKNARKNKPAYLSANLDTDKVVPYLIKDCDGVKLAVIGLTGTSVKQKTEGLKINPPDEISKLVLRLKEQGAQVVILLSTLGEKKDLELLSKVKGIDMVFVGYQPQKEEALTKVNQGFLLRPAWQGRKIGKVTLKIKDGKLIDCSLEELFLSDEISDAAEISAVLPHCYSDLNCKKQELTGICQNPGQLNAACSFEKPNEVRVTVVSAKDCRACNPEAVLVKLKNRFPGLSVNTLDYTQASAQTMIKDLSLSTLPAIIFEKKIEAENNFESIKDDLQLTNNFYVLKPQASGIFYFLHQPAKPGNFDLFFSLFDNNAALLLNTLKEFNPSLHFLATENDKGFEAKNGIGEAEEYLRAVCVQKYYPGKFWDYLICRSKNIQSSYWDDCLSGVNTSRIKNCARTQEGIDLLKENTGLNRELEIFSGPSFLLDNQEIFATRAVPDKEAFKKILGKRSSAPQGKGLLANP